MPARAERLYRRLLILLPSPLRHEAGPEMLETFRDAHARVASGSPAVRARVWAVVIADLIVTSLAERAAAARALRGALVAPDPRRFPMHLHTFALAVLADIRIGDAPDAAAVGVHQVEGGAPSRSDLNANCQARRSPADQFCQNADVTGRGPAPHRPLHPPGRRRQTHGAFQSALCVQDRPALSGIVSRPWRRDHVHEEMSSGGAGTAGDRVSEPH